ncbi:MAG TPA: chorismate-binding protein, partial [Thermoplasmata archaeon]|nr:chorismate-binding protein [Thermoplasmata archaeon]
MHRDPKELAEHRMLVDLARNDLGSVSRPGSVRLVWEERRERFARLEHLVSRVGGHLKLGLGPWDVLAAAFPAGTVSGAPKIRATQLLRQEERTWRGPY